MINDQNYDLSYKQIAEKGEIVQCEECKHDYFYPIYVLVKVDKLQSGLGKDKVFPLQAFRCAHCGHINRDWNPLEDNEDPIKE